MNIPMTKRAVAALKSLYDDRAESVRCGCDPEGRITERTVMKGQKCHLSVQRGLGAKASSSFKQTEAEGRAKISYQLYLPPECDIEAGDLITVLHCGKSITARAGEPAFGKLGIRVALDGCDPL